MRARLCQCVYAGVYTQKDDDEEEELSRVPSLESRINKRMKEKEG